MNLSTKQKETHRQREQTCACQEGEKRDVLGVLGQQMQTTTFRMNKQQDPNVWHRELFAIFCGKSQWKRI